MDFDQQQIDRGETKLCKENHTPLTPALKKNNPSIDLITSTLSTDSFFAIIPFMFHLFPLTVCVNISLASDTTLALGAKPRSPDSQTSNWGAGGAAASSERTEQT